MKNPDKYYQRHMKPKCQCTDTTHGHEDPCGSRRYLIVHHLDHARQDQSPENLITLCSSCHRKEHAQQSHYWERDKHHDWAQSARDSLQEMLLRRRTNGNT